ncbi:MAG: cell division protein FtsQ/DivIB [Gemmataceae bacterium]
MRRWLLPILGPLAGIAFLILGVKWLDRALRDTMRKDPRFLLSFDEIEVSGASKGIDRRKFLAEVKQAGGFPDTLQLLDEDLGDRINNAFARHPWVEEVLRVETLSSHGLRVELLCRTPILAVPQHGPTLAVDGKGILLPREAANDALPIWRGSSSLPLGAPGTLWGDKDIEAAASVLGLLSSVDEQIHVRAAASRTGEIHLTTQDGSRIIWGNPPGKEGKGEANAKDKLAFLVEYGAKHAGLEKPGGAHEFDLRPKEKPLVRLLRSGE